MQAVGGIRVLQLIERFHHVGNTNHLDGSRRAKQFQLLQEHLVLIGKHDLGILVVFRNTLHAGNALTQLLGNGTDERIRSHLIEGGHDLGISQCHHQDVFGGYQPSPVHAGQCYCPSQNIVKFASIL